MDNTYLQGPCNQEMIVIVLNIIEQVIKALFCFLSIHLIFIKPFEVGVTIIPTLQIGKLGAMNVVADIP